MGLYPSIVNVKDGACLGQSWKPALILSEGKQEASILGFLWRGSPGGLALVTALKLFAVSATIYCIPPPNGLFRRLLPLLSPPGLLPRDPYDFSALLSSFDMSPAIFGATLSPLQAMVTLPLTVSQLLSGLAGFLPGQIFPRAVPLACRLPLLVSILPCSSTLKMDEMSSSGRPASIRTKRKLQPRKSPLLMSVYLFVVHEIQFVKG
jgi:hypothetical protein